MSTAPSHRATDSNRFRRIQNERNLAFAGANLNHWLGFWQDLLHAPTSVSPNDCDDVCAARVSADVNEKWATALLNVLGGAVLPILYGVLGAGSAVVRSLSMRMRESLLAPRYMILAFVQVALPRIQHDLHASFTNLQWVIDAYALTLSALILTSGTLADRIGRKRVFTGGVALFTIASLLCGLSDSATLLDVAFVLPGTNIRYGVDGIVRLIPVVGDLIASAFSLWLVREARALGAPWHVTARMLGNVAIQGVVGAVPVAGDAFDVLFRANMRNVRLLRRWIDRQPV